MSWFYVIDILGWVLRVVMVPVILARRFPATTATAWLAVIFFLPWVGVPIYLMIGDARLGRKRAKRHRALLRLTRASPRLTQEQRELVQPSLDPDLLPVATQASKVGGMGVLGGNHVELMSESDGVIERLIADIDAAEHHVHLLFYIFEDDATGQCVAEALAGAVRRGVRVRVLADAAGSWNFFARAGLSDALCQVGATINACMPVTLLRRRLYRLDLRNHRKLAVIDGQVAYTGSQNIVNADMGHPRAGRWLDMMGRFTGPVVAQLQMVFLDDWLFETGKEVREPHLFPKLQATGNMMAQGVPTGPGEDLESLPRVLVSAINHAQKRIYITTPYLVPDEATLLALGLAVDRGVDVRIVIPRRCDHWLVTVAGRAYYEPLLEAGVKLFIHQHGLLHAKTMTVDDAFALLGSANLDIRSFYLNFELNVLLYGPEIAGQMAAEQERYMADSQPLRLESWRRRPRHRRFVENAAALLSPLL